MPLVKRKVSPVRLARRESSWGTTDSGEEVTLRGEYDLTAVTNVTLCGALRQLASLVTAAQDVSQELQEELGKINIRSNSLASRLAVIEGRVAAHQPRAVPVREYPPQLRQDAAFTHTPGSMTDDYSFLTHTHEMLFSAK